MNIFGGPLSRLPHWKMNFTNNFKLMSPFRPLQTFPHGREKGDSPLHLLWMTVIRYSADFTKGEKRNTNWNKRACSNMQRKIAKELWCYCSKLERRNESQHMTFAVGKDSPWAGVSCTLLSDSSQTQGWCSYWLPCPAGRASITMLIWK